MFGVVREHPRIWFREARATAWTSALDGEVRLLKYGCHVVVQLVERPDHAHDALPVFECAANAFAQGCFIFCFDDEIANGQFDIVFFKAI